MTSPILPPLRRTEADARTFAELVHATQADRGGRSFVEHLADVAGRAARKIAGMPGILSPAQADEVVQIAWLHDAIEDRRSTADELLREGFSPSVVGGVRWLTKPENADYAAWIEAIAEGAPLAALLVAISGVEDDIDPDRLSLLPAEAAERLRGTCAPALDRLRAAAIGHGWRPVED